VIEYVAADPARETIPWVRVKDRSGRSRDYVAEGVDAKTLTGTKRRMDCLDCHNRPAHPFAASPERAVDAAIADGRLSRALPFGRRQAVAALRVTGDPKEAALAAVAQSLRTFYERSYPDVAQAKRPELDRLVSAAQELYRRHVFPSMKVTWGTYPDHVGHIDTPGCFRCHDDSHKAADGAVIRQDCDSCHTQEDAPAPSVAAVASREGTHAPE
jgi:hypothetical protein